MLQLAEVMTIVGREVESLDSDFKIMALMGVGR